jgi:hypothetical protein
VGSERLIKIGSLGKVTVLKLKGAWDFDLKEWTALCQRDLLDLLCQRTKRRLWVRRRCVWLLVEKGNELTTFTRTAGLACALIFSGQ